MVLLRSCVLKNDNHQSAEDTTEKNHAILSCLRNFDFFVNIFCRGSFLKTPRGDVSTGMLQSQGCFFKILNFHPKSQSNSLRCSASLREENSLRQLSILCS